MSAGAADEPITPPPDPTRRRVMAAAVTALATPFLPALAIAAVEPASSPPAAPNELEASAEALVGYLAVHFAPHLTAGSMRQDVGRDLTGLLRAAAAVRAVELANHEEPDFLFAATGPW